MYMVYDFRTGTIRPLDAISRAFFLRDPILKRVKTMKGSTCLEDLITVAILSVPSTWDVGLLCMNNLVVGTWAQVGPRAGFVENEDLEESVTTLLVI